MDTPRPHHRVKVEGLAPARKVAANATHTPAPAAPLLVGHGYDIHKLQPGGKLMLAGVQVSDQFGPIAHSDGDVAIHALVDALLGALGLGDIGEHFPNSDPQWKDSSSSVFLKAAVEQVHQAGYRIVNADVTILAERPKISPFKSQMVRSLSELLAANRVNIKAGTNEGCDAIGQGQAIAAHAVVLLALL